MRGENQRLRSLWLVITSLSAMLAPHVGAEELTLGEAVAMAVESHPSVAIASARIDVADASLDESESARWPRISVASSLLQYEEAMVVTPIHGFGAGQFPEFDDTLIQNALNLELLLWDGGGVPAQVRSSEAAIESATAAAASARDALILRTAAIYLAILSRRQSLQAHDARIEALEAEQNRVGQMVRVGRAAEVDRLRVEAAIAAAAAERSTVETALNTALRELSRLVSNDAEAISPADVAMVHLVDSSPAERDTLISIALENNPSVARARSELRQREASVALARSIYFPQVRAVGSWLQFGDGSLSFDDEWNIGVRVRIPIWDGGATSARVAQARAAVRVAEEQVRLEELQVLDQLDAALAAVEEAQMNLTALEVAGERFEEVARIENLRLNNGVGTQIDYLQAEADLLDVRAGVAAARHRLILARVDLARVLGELDEFWFDRHLTNASPRSDT